MKFLCPECKGEQHCPCENCKEKNEDKITWIWIDGNGPIECGHCGHSMSVDEWMHEEMKQFEEFKEAEKEIDSTFSSLRNVLIDNGFNPKER